MRISKAVVAGIFSFLLLGSVCFIACHAVAEEAKVRSSEITQDIFSRSYPVNESNLVVIAAIDQDGRRVVFCAPDNKFFVNPERPHFSEFCQAEEIMPFVIRLRMDDSIKIDSRNVFYASFQFSPPDSGFILHDYFIHWFIQPREEFVNLKRLVMESDFFQQEVRKIYSADQDTAESK